MTVKELIKELKKHDPDRLVIMSSDAEGNSYSPVYDMGACGYVANSTWSGDICIEELTEQDKKDGYTEEDLDPDAVPALAIYPTN